MKKYISLAFMAVALSFGFTSCCVETNEEPGGTNVEKMAGRWNVVVDAVDESGNVLYEDPYGLGTFTIMTYNTADNGVNKMWLDDNKKFWAFKMKVDVNYIARTFSWTVRSWKRLLRTCMACPTTVLCSISSLAMMTMG